MIVQSWLVAAILTYSPFSGQSVDTDPRLGRTLLGKEVSLSPEDLADLGVPKGVKPLLQSQSHCPDSEKIGVSSMIALACDHVTKVRSCVGVGPKVPTFVGRGCKGQTCTMDFVPGPPECFLDTIGVKRQPDDPKLNATCGIMKQDSHWVDPNPKSGIGFDGKKCFEPDLPGAQAHMWVDCKNGEMGHLHKMMNFSASEVKMPKKQAYTCKFSPRCTSDGEPIFRMVCYEEIDFVASNKTVGHQEKPRKKKATKQSNMKKKIEKDGFKNLTNLNKIDGSLTWGVLLLLFIVVYGWS